MIPKQHLIAEIDTMHLPDPFTCVDQEALHLMSQRYGLCCFFVDTLGDPGPVAVRDGEAYRPDVKETIAWYSGHKEVIKLLYHRHSKSIAFLSSTTGRGSWADLDQQRIRDLSRAAGYTVGCFVHQYHPCDRMWLFPNPNSFLDPAMLKLALSPAITLRLPVVTRLILAVSTMKIYPQRTCVVGWGPDDAYVVDAARRLSHADIDFCQAEEFFSLHLTV